MAALVFQGQSCSPVDSPRDPQSLINSLAFYVEKFFHPVWESLKDILLDCKPFQDKGRPSVSRCPPRREAFWHFLKYLFIDQLVDVSRKSSQSPVEQQTGLFTSRRFVPFITNGHTVKVSRDPSNFWPATCWLFFGYFGYFSDMSFFHVLQKTLILTLQCGFHLFPRGFMH